jgi:hypothetical protein
MCLNSCLGSGPCGTITTPLTSVDDGLATRRQARVEFAGKRVTEIAQNSSAQPRVTGVQVGKLHTPIHLSLQAPDGRRAGVKVWGQQGRCWVVARHASSSTAASAIAQRRQVRDMRCGHGGGGVVGLWARMMEESTFVIVTKMPRLVASSLTLIYSLDGAPQNGFSGFSANCAPTSTAHYSNERHDYWALGSIARWNDWIVWFANRAM